jgi:hypothetical protein
MVAEALARALARALAGRSVASETTVPADVDMEKKYGAKLDWMLGGLHQNSDNKEVVLALLPGLSCIPYSGSAAKSDSSVMNQISVSSGRTFVVVVLGLASVGFSSLSISVDGLDHRAMPIKYDGGADQLLQPLAANSWAGMQITPSEVDEQGSCIVNATAIVDNVVQLFQGYVALGTAPEYVD